MNQTVQVGVVEVRVGPMLFHRHAEAAGIQPTGARPCPPALHRYAHDQAGDRLLDVKDRPRHASITSRQVPRGNLAPSPTKQPQKDVGADFLISSVRCVWRDRG